jgi:ribosomal-protein-serine acetyltransferase
MGDPILLDLPTYIETPRLILRPPQAGDGPGIYKAITDGYSALVKWLNWPSNIPSKEQVEIEARIHQAKWILREDMRFVCINRESGEIMGRMAYPSIQTNWDIPIFGISYFMSKSHQRLGYTQEAVNALTRYAFEVLDAKKVEIKCDVENPASIGIPKKLGFKLEARQKGVWPRKDKHELAEIVTYARFDMINLLPLEVRWSSCS